MIVSPKYLQIINHSNNKTKNENLINNSKIGYRSSLCMNLFLSGENSFSTNYAYCLPERSSMWGALKNRNKKRKLFICELSSKKYVRLTSLQLTSKTKAMKWMSKCCRHKTITAPQNMPSKYLELVHRRLFVQICQERHDQS